MKLRVKLYTDLSAAVSSIFSNRRSPIILPEKTIRALMRMRRDWFINTVYWDEPTLIYEFGSLTPVHPIQVDALASILHLPKSLHQARAVLYCITSLGAPRDCVGQEEATDTCCPKGWAAERNSSAQLQRHEGDLVPLYGGPKSSGRLPVERVSVRRACEVFDGHRMGDEFLWLPVS